jgi:tight adherence protein B
VIEIAATCVCFAAVTGIVAAVAMLIRDLTRPDPDVQRRLESVLGRLALAQTPALASQGVKAGSRIDRAFYHLVESSGSRLDGPTALALVAGMAIIGCVAPFAISDNPLFAALGTVLGVALPLCWWTVRRSRRLAAMRKVLPETLELIADGVRAGQTIEGATQLVAAEGPSPLNEEFGYCASQLRLGHSPVAVLQRMARRVPLPEFKIFGTAALVHRQTGGNLALLAQRLANSARDRSEFHGHVRAVTAGHRMSVIALSIGTVVAIAFLTSLEPDYLGRFLEHPWGIPLLGIAAVMQVLGIVWVWRILRINY